MPTSAPKQGEAPGGGKDKAAAGGSPEEQMARVEAAAKAMGTDPSHPMNKYADRVADADFGAGVVGTVRSTKGNPLSAADHQAMDRAHSLVARGMMLQGDEEGARAQLSAAKYHRDLAARKAAGAGAGAASAGPQALPEPAPREANFRPAEWTDAKAVNAAVRDVFGGRMPKHFAAAVNAQGGAQVDVYPADDGDGLKVETLDEARGYYAGRSFRKDEEGKLVCENELFTIRDKLPDGSPNPMKGKGSEIFAEQVAALKAAGVDRIETHAARDDSPGNAMNGYYTWARLGYDGEIPASTLGKMPAGLKRQLKGRTNVQSLMGTPEGRDFWKEHGDSFDASFDLKEGSQSVRTLTAYLAERKAKRGAK